MNSFRIGPMFVSMSFASILIGHPIIFDSNPPLPEALEKAIEQDIAVQQKEFQPGIYVCIHGACRISKMESADLDRPLGWIDIVDGEMLSIVHVDCARIGEALWRIVVNPQSPETRELIAHAIARVIRHELHHLSTDSVKHEKQGDYKASLRAEQLAAPLGATVR